MTWSSRKDILVKQRDCRRRPVWPGGAEEPEWAPGERCAWTTDTGREGWEPPQLLHTWRFYSAPTGIWGNFRSCYGDRSPQEDFFLMCKMKTLCCVREKQRPASAHPWPKNSVPRVRGEPHHRCGAAVCGRITNSWWSESNVRSFPMEGKESL